MNAIEEVKILFAFIRNSNSSGEVDFKKTTISKDLEDIGIPIEKIENFLFEKTKEAVISYEEIGEEGFEPIIIASISKQTHKYMEAKINEAEQELLNANERLRDLLSFDPKQLSKDIASSHEKLLEAKNKIEKSEILRPLMQPLSKIMSHLNSVKRVSDSYDEIYKNIIKPSQEEGRLGIKATVKWAIISIVISTLASLILSNWNSIRSLFTAYHK